MADNNIKIEGELVTKALQIDSLNKEILNSIHQNDHDKLLDLLEEYGVLKKDIKTILLYNPFTKIHNKKAQKILRAISSDEESFIDRLIQFLENKIDEKIIYDDPFDGMNLNEDWEILEELFYTWFSPNMYVRRLYRINALILGTSIPGNLIAYIEEARQCFAFQQFIALFSLCRTILETAVRDVGKRKGKIPKDKGKVKEMESRKTYWGDMVREVIPKHLKAEFNNIYFSTSFLIHGHKTIMEKQSIEMFKRTITAVHNLYDHHHFS